MLTMYCYKKCSTCKRAEKFLLAHALQVQVIDYTEQPLSEEQLKEYYMRSGLDIRAFFNTSGLVYRHLGLKTTLASLTLAEKIKLLADNPMLVKRPLLVGETFVSVGFKEDIWRQQLGLIG